MAALKQVGENFGAKISNFKNPAIYAKMFILSQLLQFIGKFLLAHIPIKTVLDHQLCDGSSFDRAFLKVNCGVSDTRNDLIGAYLRSGKELILTKMATITDYDHYLDLEKELSSLVIDILRSISDNLFFDYDINIRIKRVAFMRLLDKISTAFDKEHLDKKISILSLDGMPVVETFHKALLKGFPGAVVKYNERLGCFKPKKIDFNDYSKWYAELDGVKGKLVRLSVSGTDLIDKLKSTLANERNGILDGDEMMAYYVLIHDRIENKKIYEIKNIIGFRRSDQPWQQQEFDYSP